DPDEGRYHRQLGLVLMMQSRGQEAEREFAIAMHADPEDWRAMLAMGNLFHAEKRYDEEAAAYKKVIKILPADQSALKQKLEKFIAADEANVKKATEIAKKKKE